MTINQFRELSPFERVTFLNESGVFLAERRLAANRFYLFAVAAFYVELTYGPQGLRGRGVRFHRVFEDTKYLDAYLEGVDINGVKENLNI